MSDIIVSGEEDARNQWMLRRSTYEGLLELAEDRNCLWRDDRGDEVHKVNRIGYREWEEIVVGDVEPPHEHSVLGMDEEEWGERGASRRKIVKKVKRSKRSIAKAITAKRIKQVDPPIPLPPLPPPSLLISPHYFLVNLQQRLYCLACRGRSNPTTAMCSNMRLHLVGWPPELFEHVFGGWPVLGNEAVQRVVGDNLFHLRGLREGCVWAPSIQVALDEGGAFRELRVVDASEELYEVLNAFCGFDSVAPARQGDTSRGAMVKLGTSTTRRVVYQLMAGIDVDRRRRPHRQVQCALYMSVGLYAVSTGRLRFHANVDCGKWPHYHDLRTALAQKMNDVVWG